MQDRNARAPKVRSGDEINPVLGTIVKISVLVVIAALVVLTTLIIIEFSRRNKSDENVFKDKMHIEEEDFKIITSHDYRQNEGKSFDDLSNDIRDVMEEVHSDDNVYFFFYYSDLSKEYEEELTELINSRDDNNPLFLIDLNMRAPEDEEGNKLPTILDYLNTVDELNSPSSGPEYGTITQNKEKYEYFLIVYNEEEYANNENPFKILTNFSAIEKNVVDLLEKEEEED